MSTGSPDNDTFEALLTPALGRLYRTAFRLAGNVADAEDLVQDTCVLACEKLAMLRAAAHPERWLMRVLYNRFVDGTRRRSRSPFVRQRTATGPESLAANDQGPADIAEQTDGERALMSACDKLSPSHRALLSLRAEGYGLAEIEEITGVSRDVLRARLQRARSSLARYLEQDQLEDGPRSRLGSRS